MTYPYLLNRPALYSPYASYETALEAIRTNSREDNEAYVKLHWPHAFVYEHGRDWTVLPFDWRVRNRIQQETPELLSLISIPAYLSFTRKIPREEGLGYYDYSPEYRSKAEAGMWKLAAATWTEYMRTSELKQ